MDPHIINGFNQVVPPDTLPYSLTFGGGLIVPNKEVMKTINKLSQENNQENQNIEQDLHYSWQR
ncbi:hypothetical protein DICPUDRAFT_153954 [Dictyostelium purpureum]|uniref:Uncharacterized protein n=1 Tax=Dictyostelium purpureum TaxID=5786 RepID=F0ZQ64_DICPU|nr:uncharacterized protein DICPUDRAFT_153954 [Dictyostelium purpureum]EGC33914.1 hypothetical protein DICPUDRAFT_153954 [Dictyostelium purpureum]|eukprot:XP_003289549.1 hypothetical protein DICPUDRAFT_153954 [Dictyostelium purpureum]